MVNINTVPGTKIKRDLCIYMFFEKSVINIAGVFPPLISPCHFF